ncbi:MAG: hypothetical protein IKX59_07445 [Bacteroidales bacterium]|nr:hypothetical protein [Bacteroidales bacterium]
MKKLIILAMVVVLGVSFVSLAQDVIVIRMKDNLVRNIKVEEVRKVVVCDINSFCPIAEAIDLGLPSRTKWASWNVGASAPEENGGFYAWGETEIKEVYTQDTYKYYDEGSFVDIGNEIAGTEYDVAHVKWGGEWRMPSSEQMKELFDNCSKKWAPQNGARGYLFTGPNGASIFLPAAGYQWNTNNDFESFDGFYWISSSERYESWAAYYVSVSSEDYDEGRMFNRSFGLSVRAVCP